MRFLRPEFLDLRFIIPLFLFIILIIYFGLKSKFKARNLWQKSKLKEFSRFSSKTREIIVYFLGVLVISLTVLALSRPQISYEKKIIIKKPLDIVCLVDLSRSMNTKDALWQGRKLFRLDLVKEELKSFVENYVGKDKNQMAMIAFANKAMYRSFFDNNVGPLLFHVDNLNTQDFPPEGTDIGLAIVTGLEMLNTIDNNPGVFGRRKNKRVFILISDGEDNVEDELSLNQAITETQQKRIPIYTIGIGSKKGDYIIEEVDENGNEIFMTDEDTGEKVFSKLEEETLKEIAQLTDGKYVYSQNSEALSRALDELLARETDKETKIEKAYYDIYHYLLLISFVLCLIIIILKQN